MPRLSPYRGKWLRVRRAILERDEYLCKIQLPGCTVEATEVDHIVPVLQGGDWWDPDNLRAGCRPCNLKRRGGRSSHQWRAGRTFITLVVGPPGADLTAYVRANRQPSDMVVDAASLERDLGSAATTARNAMINDLRRGKVEAPRAWITSHAPDAGTTLPHHRLVTLGGDGPATTRAAAPSSSSSQPQRPGASASRQW